MEPQAEVCPVPVGVLQIRRGGEIIEFHLFHQEGPWHGGATPSRSHTHTRTQRHTRVSSLLTGSRALIIRRIVFSLIVSVSALSPLSSLILLSNPDLVFSCTRPAPLRLSSPASLYLFAEGLFFVLAHRFSHRLLLLLSANRAKE